MAGFSLPTLNVRSLLRSYGLNPSKGLGQNFLQDPSALEKIVATAALTASDEVLEIGPGLGNLTRYLALSARQVTAVELDRKLIPVLNDILAPYHNIRLVQGDILKLDPSELMANNGYIVVANIPYYITSAVLRHLLGSDRPPRRVVLTVQAEVAERICASAGNFNLLALSVQVYGEPEIGPSIPAGAFYPAPKVDSSILKIEIHPEPLMPPDRLELFFRLAKAGFSQKRKTLRNSLSAGLRLTPPETEKLLRDAGIDPQRRAETVTLKEWGNLSREYARTV